MKTGKLFGYIVCVFAMGLVGCASSDPNRTTGRAIDDRNINARVADALKGSPVYKFPHVRVSTFNGVVQLSGFVVKDEQKAEAAELTRRVAGVTEVINNISLAPVGAPGAYDASGRKTNSPPTRY
jgi:osmotically-inducible protein OsmY